MSDPVDELSSPPSQHLCPPRLGMTGHRHMPGEGCPERLRHDARPHREAAQLYNLRSSTYAYAFYTVDETDTDSMQDDRVRTSILCV